MRSARPSPAASRTDHSTGRLVPTAGAAVPLSRPPAAGAGRARIRMGMSQSTAEALAARLADAGDTGVERRLLDQLWLRTTLIEQYMRTRLSERRAFERRADTLLSALDPD